MHSVAGAVGVVLCLSPLEWEFARWPVYGQWLDTFLPTMGWLCVVVATATSNRQTRALAAHVQDRAREAGYPVVSVEGEETGEWVLVDLGDIIVHIMQPAIRAYYNLEELWGTHPVELPLPRPSTHKGHARKDEDAAPQGAQA